MTARYLFLICLILPAVAVAAPALKFPSPDGRFALRIAETPDADNELPAELVEQATGKSLAAIGSLYVSDADQAILLWSPDSKYAAFGSRGAKNGDTEIHRWNGATFEGVKLPITPDPIANFRKLNHGREPQVRIYSDIVQRVDPVRRGAHPRPELG